MFSSPVIRSCAGLLFFLTLAVTPALAGGDSGGCRAEESRLRSLEAEQCNGFGYVFNPSACFNTRKALRPYQEGKCQALKPVTGGEQAVQEKPSTPAEVVLDVSPAQVNFIAAEQPGKPRITRASTQGGKVGLTELEELRLEIAALRAELEMVKREVEALRGGK